MARHSLESEVVIDLVDIVSRGRPPAGEAGPSIAAPVDAERSVGMISAVQQETPVSPRAESDTEAMVSEPYETASEYGMESYPGWIAYRSEESETMLVDPIPEEPSRQGTEMVDPDTLGKHGIAEQNTVSDTTKAETGRGRAFSPGRMEGADVCAEEGGPEDKETGFREEPLSQVAPVLPNCTGIETRLASLERRMTLVEANVATLASRIEILETERESVPAEEAAVPTGHDDLAVSENTGNAVDEPGSLAGHAYILDTLASLGDRVTALEALPPCPDKASVVQEVLDVTRREIDSYTSEQTASITKILSEMQRRIRELEMRPAPQLILPELPDAEGIVETVLERLRGELDSTVATVAARVLREEIAALRKTTRESSAV